MVVHSLSQSLTDMTVESWQSTVFHSPQLMGQWNHGSSQSVPVLNKWDSGIMAIHTVFPSPQLVTVYTIFIFKLCHS